MDRNLVTGTWNSDYVDCRGGLFPLDFGIERRARCRTKKAEGSKTKHQRRSQSVRRKYPPRSLRLEDHFLRAGLHADARGCQRIQLESQLRRNRPDVAW